PATLLALALGRARGVVLLTGDDLVNLEAASAIRDAHPKLPVVAHVADLGLRRRLAELGEEDGTFNAHRLAARHLFETGLAERLRETAEKDVLVLVGFGRFGQTILEELRTHREIADELRAVVVVDRQAAKLLRFFTDEVGEAHPPVRAVDGDVADPDTWRRVSEALGGLEATAPPFYVLGTDDDALNLRVAMALRREGEVGEGELVAVRGAHCHIVARVFAPSSFTRALGERFDFRVLPIAELLRAAVRERAGRWFRRR
ncbi:MAG TPA: NAD-binding protein, partial [Polyangiaceae bacterium LLY-WYZ-15_(1-7)]|nr:NAD-binding protein [Polyangiaceae bacterium LLY-WYZ-15_(1-7)]